MSTKAQDNRQHNDNNADDRLDDDGNLSDDDDYSDVSAAPKVAHQRLGKEVELTTAMVASHRMKKWFAASFRE